jgi:hypothetical protein
MIHQFSKFWKFCFLRKIETSLVIMFCTQDTVFVYLRSLLFCQKFCMMSVIFLRKIETSLDIIIFCTQGAVFVYLIISNSKKVPCCCYLSSSHPRDYAGMFRCLTLSHKQGPTLFENWLHVVKTRSDFFNSKWL